MAILGLLSTEAFAAQRFTNIRRQVFYFYPNGAAPLTGLMSLMQEEDTNDPRFTWYEKRLDTQTTTTVSLNAAGPYSAPVASIPALTTGDATTGAGGFTITANYYLNVAVSDATKFRVNHQIKVTASPMVASTIGNKQGNNVDVIGIVVATSTTTSPQYLSIQVTQAYGAPATLASLLNDTTAVGLEVLVIGNSAAQGIGDISSQIYNLPVPLENYCQIYRTPFSMTGSALKTSAKYDESGPYKDKAKEHSIYHMIEMEKSFIFGQRSLQSVDPVSGLPRYTTGGILWWLQQWEAGTLYSNTAASYDTDDNKRIITLNTGVLSLSFYNTLLERLFRVTNTIVFEKLCLCGSGFLSVINQMYENRTQFQSDVPMEDAYGMNVVRHVTPFGTVYYKSHPLFSQNPNLRYNALFIDVRNLRYRYLQGRDTELYRNRQPNDADYRKDEWVGEAGLEFRFPESHMYLMNVKKFIN